MSPERRLEIKTRIEKRMEESGITIAQLQKTSRQVSLKQLIGRMSRMDFMTNQAISGHRLSNSRHTPMRLERAPERIGDENFGVCAKCDEDIALGRLIMPEATPSVDCAE